MEAIVSRDEIYETTMAVREQTFDALVKAINEEIRNAANSGRQGMLWDAKEHPDFLWDNDIADRLKPLLQEAGYDVTFGYESFFSSYVGCTIKWAKKEPETNKEEPEEPIMEESKKRKWGRKNK